MPGTKASAALLQAVADAALQIVQDEHCYVATSGSSTPILAEHLATLANPDTSTSTPTSVRAAVELSKVVDLVQDGSPVFDWQRIGQPFLSEIYPSITGNVRFARATLTGKDLEEYEQAQAKLFDDPPLDKTEAYERYLELQTQIAYAKADLLMLKRELSTADAAKKPALTERISAIEEGLKVQEPLFAALDRQHGFEDAVRIYESAQLVDIPKSFKDACDLMAVGGLVISTVDGIESHVRAAFSPGRIAEENWIKVRVGREEIGKADVNNPLIPPPRAGDQVATLDETAIDSIELEIQLLKVERFWCWDPLFVNRMWQWETPDEPVSTGGQKPQGKIPAYTVGLVIARNLRISGRKPLLPPSVVGSPAILRIANFQFAVPKVAPAGRTVEFTPHAKVPGQLMVKPLTPRVQRRLDVTALPKAMTSLALRAQVQHAVAQGRIVDERDQPVADATVQARHTGTGQVMAKTSAQNGEVSFELREPAAHEVTVTKPGFTAAKQTIAFKPGGQFTVKLQRAFDAKLTLLRTADLRLAQPASPMLRPLPDLDIDTRPERPPRPPVVRPVPLTVRLAKVAEGGKQEAMDAPVRVQVVDADGATRVAVTAAAGEAVSAQLPAGAYSVTAYCDVYDAVGPGSQQVSLIRPADVSFSFAPRTILESRDMYLMAVMGRRVPKSPDPNPDARW